VSYDSERKVFVARVPELPPCVGEGASRGEALLHMERELDALLQNLADSGGRVPPAIDDLPAGEELRVKVSRSLQRDLAFAAQVEGVELGQLVAELLAAGLEGRPHPQEAGNAAPPGEEPPRRDRPHAQPGQHGHEGEGRWRDRGERNTAGRFHNLLEDRASFMEYVRGLESEGGHGRPRGGYDNRGGGGRRNFSGQGQGQGQGRGGDRPHRDRGAGPRPGGPAREGNGGGSDGGPSGSAPPT
jgi:predicted RNase H-like HicB family nuclease